MIILGINDGHSAGACVLVDGRVAAAFEQERFSRKKNDFGFCPQAVDGVLSETGISTGDLDLVAVSTRDLPYSAFATRKYPDWGVKDHLYEQEHYWKPKLAGEPTSDYLEVLKNFLWREKCFYGLSALPPNASSEDVRHVRHRGITKYLGVKPEIVRFVDHHTCHAHHAYYSSPIRGDALVLTIDGFGDGCNASVGCVRDGHYARIHATGQCNLGRINALMTLLLSMKPAEEEYKVMGLAAYAKRHNVAAPLKVFKETLYVDGLDFAYKNRVNDHYHYYLEHLRPYRFDAIAGALQRFTEDLLANWCRNAVEHTGLRDVVISGGVAQNIKACKAVADLDEVRNVRRINETIKNRDFWMPFSPSILAERAGDYLVNPKGLASPYMTMAFDSTELARREIIAGLHPNDYTVRPQIVSRRACPLYYGIIKAFEKLTGVGAVLNTSLNIHGKPIVRTPLEAVEEVLSHPLVELDYLLINRMLLVRKARCAPAVGGVAVTSAGIL